MSWLQPLISIINMVIFVGILWFLFDLKRKQKLPDNPASRLEAFVRMASRASKKRYPNNPGKKDLIIGHVVDLYREWDLPAPSKPTIELAIDAEEADK